MHGRPDATDCSMFNSQLQSIGSGGRRRKIYCLSMQALKQFRPSAYRVVCRKKPGFPPGFVYQTVVGCGERAEGTGALGVRAALWNHIAVERANFSGKQTPCSNYGPT